MRIHPVQPSSWAIPLSHCTLSCFSRLPAGLFSIITWSLKLKTTMNQKQTIFLGSFGTLVKNLTANTGDVSSITGSERAPGRGNGNPLQYSCLENSRGAWQAVVHRVAKSQTQQHSLMREETPLLSFQNHCKFLDLQLTSLKILLSLQMEIQNPGKTCESDCCQDLKSNAHLKNTGLKQHLSSGPWCLFHFKTSVRQCSGD